MKKFVTALLLVGLAMAGVDYELKLFETVVLAIFQKQTIKVYASKDVKSVLKNSKKLIVQDQCSNAVVLIGKEFSNLAIECQNKPIFSTNYRYYQKTSTSFGVFYWRKGRPQLKFNTNKLVKFGLILPTFLEKFRE